MWNKRISRRSFLAFSGLTAASLALNKERIAFCAKKMGPPSEYPTVVIGAGLGGLCCAAYLAKQGIPVTVVEQRKVPGGYACSFERAGGRFTFDVSLHGMSAKNNAAARILEDLGILSELSLVELSEVYQLQSPSHSLSVPQRDPEAYIRVLSSHFPNERKGIREFIGEILGIAEEVDKLHRKGKYSKLLFPFQYPKLYGVLDKNLADLMKGYVKDPALQNILASLWDFHGLPPSEVSGLFYAAAKGDVLKNGTYYVKKRSQDLSRALAEVIERSGGRVLYGHMVEEISLRNGSVHGVVTNKGNILPARAVVSNANIIDTFRRMLPQRAVPGDYLKKLETCRPSLSTFIVWLGLNQELRGQLDVCGIQILSRQGPESDYNACLKGDIDRVPFRIGFYDNFYEGYSRSGTSTLRIFCLCGYEPWRRFEADYKAGRKEEYTRQKERWTQTLIHRAEEVVPGLSSMIEVAEAGTPLTNWRFTRNFEGAIYGFEQSVENASIKRIDDRTPIKALYLASAWCNPGGGFAGVLISGQMAFRDMMEDWAR
jgi:prolycopene isomerase